MNNILTRFLVLLCVFVPGTAVFAHGGHSGPDVTVGGVVEGERDTLKGFVEHAAGHLQRSESFTEALDLLYSFRDEAGRWNDGSVYLVLLTTNGGVYVHPGSRELEDQDWSDLADSTGKNVGREFLGGGFVGYGEGKEAYAFRFSAPFIPFANPNNPEFVLVGGFDYEPAPVDIEATEAPCEQLLTRYGLTGRCPSVTAGDVEDIDDLKVFLDQARHFFTAAFVSPQTDPVILRRFFRLEGGPWREGATYIWIQSERGRAIFNGVNRNIEQQNLWEEEDDDGDKYIQELITAAGVSGAGEGLEYNWENPLVEGDGEGGGPGGSSRKLGYSIRIPVPLEGETKGNTRRVYIFGSGIYLGSEDDDDSGGCVVAGVGAGGTPKSSLLNLLLIGFAVIALVFRNGNNADFLSFIKLKFYVYSEFLFLRFLPGFFSLTFPSTRHPAEVS